MKGKKESVIPLTTKPRLCQKVTKKSSLFHFDLFNRKSVFDKYMKNMEDDNEMAKLTSVHIVPLPDFLVYPHGIKDEKVHLTKLIKRLLKLIFWPRKHVIRNNESDHSSFSRMLRQRRNELMCNNPSLEACIKFKFSSARWYYIRHLIHYLLFALMVSLMLDLGGDPSVGEWDSAMEFLYTIFNPKIYTIYFTLTAYLSYYLLAIELVQVKQDKVKRYLNFYNFIDLASILFPFASVLGNYIYRVKIYAVSIKFINSGDPSADDLHNFLADKYDIDKFSVIAKIANSFIVLILWLEFLLLLRFFSRPAHFINLIIDIVKSIWPFLVFMLIVIFGFGHAMFILLQYGVTELGSGPNFDTFKIYSSASMLLDNSNDPFQNIIIKKEFNDENDNYFVSFWKSVEAVYYWPA
ncbi:12526_t:CDS:2, partial [Entrophospora sp. SA101]